MYSLFEPGKWAALHASETSAVVKEIHFMKSGKTTDSGGSWRNMVSEIPVFSGTIEHMQHLRVFHQMILSA